MKEWTTVNIPLAAGLDTKGDARASSPPTFDLLRDAEFREPGGLQTRYPYALSNTSIFGGGTLADTRRLYQNGSELICLTKSGLYSWSPALDKWVLKGTHLAIKVDEQTAFATTGDQIDCDRAELSGTIVYGWEEASVGYVAAVDKTTGAVLMAPTAITGSASRLRLTALTTKILLTFHDTVAGVYGYALDPASPATALAGASTTISPTGGGYYDICKVPSADQAVFASRLAPTTSYRIGTCTAGMTVATSTKARVCDGPIAVSCDPTGTSVQVVRGNSTNVQGDLITISTLADVYTAQAVGTCTGTLNQIAAAHRSVTDSGVYRCYAFWSSAESAGATDWQSKTNYVSTGNTLGTQATFVRRLGVASRAFDHEGRIFVWLAFAGESSFSGANSSLFRAQLQNSYFLYRDDTTLHAKSTFQRAGGFSASTCHLPGVALVGDGEYAWCGVERRVISLGESQSGYGARAPRDIAITFDSNEARRCARLGQTLYITGGEILQYDGTQLVELGYHVYPWYFGAIEVGAGNLADGTYAIKNTWRWDNARGEIDRSTTATVGTVTIAGGPNGISIVSWMPLYVSHKTGVAVEVWRTEADPIDESPFHLVTSKDPAALTNPNRYIPNAPTSSSLATFNDEFADATAAAKEANPENGSVLENLAPPAATIIAATADRLFLAGVAGDPHRVWYSKLRGDGEVPAFHDALTIQIPRNGGDVTAIGFINDTLIVFKETAIYACAGDGFDNLGGGQNYGPARALSSDVGAVSAEAVALTEKGLIFKSDKGWCLLNRGWAVDYIGGPVDEFDADEVYAVHAIESKHQIRCLTSARMLVLDTLMNQWSEWTIADGVHAAIWEGTYAYLTSASAKLEQTTYDDINYGLDAETAWIKLNDLQGAGAVRWLAILGEYRGIHELRVRLARDYLQDGAGEWLWYQDENWTPSPTVVGGPEQVRIGPSIPKCTAIKVRITVGSVTDTGPEPAELWSEAIKLTGLALDVGIDQGINRRLPVAQKVGT